MGEIFWILIISIQADATPMQSPTVRSISKNQSSPSPQPSPSPSLPYPAFSVIGDKVGVKTYRSDFYNLQFNLPSNWLLDELKPLEATSLQTLALMSADSPEQRQKNEEVIKSPNAGAITANEITLAIVKPSQYVQSYLNTISESTGTPDPNIHSTKLELDQIGTISGKIQRILKEGKRTELIGPKTVNNLQGFEFLGPVGLAPITKKYNLLLVKDNYMFQFVFDPLNTAKDFTPSYDHLMDIQKSFIQSLRD